MRSMHILYIYQYISISVRHTLKKKRKHTIAKFHTSLPLVQVCSGDSSQEYGKMQSQSISANGRPSHDKTTASNKGNASSWYDIIVW